MTFSLDTRAHSEVGLVRKNNQDSGYVSPTMILVADGMGGAAAGDLASTVAVREILRSDGHYTLDQTGEVLAGALARANHTLADLVQQDPSLDGMGTTVCGALFTGTELGLVHIGDSRGYLLRGGVLHRLTHDHSWVQSLVDEGKISLDEAAVHPHRSLLLKVLNGQPTHDPDLDTVDLQLGDRVLFCSDGLCGFVSDHTIRHILDTALDLDDAMGGLVRAAHAGGGADNITVLLADVMPQSDALDARGSVVVGAALENEVPEVAEHTLAGLDLQLTPEAGATDERIVESTGDLGVLDDDEASRYAPTAIRRRHRLQGALGSVLVLALLAGGLFGGWRWSRTQYYIGADQAQVAVFRGLPGTVFGHRLSEVAEPTDILVADLPHFYRDRVATTIPVANLDAAHTTVGSLRDRAAGCIARRTPRPTPGTAPSSAPSPAVSAPITPGAVVSTGLPLPPGTPSATSLVGPTSVATAVNAPATAPSSTPSSSGAALPDEDC